MEEYNDTIIYLDVRHVTGNIALYVESAPSKDDPRDSNGNPTFFQAIATQSLTATTDISRTFVLRVLVSTAAIPLARYLRWRVGSTDGTAWDITFRATIAVTGEGC